MKLFCHVKPLNPVNFKQLFFSSPRQLFSNGDATFLFCFEDLFFHRGSLFSLSLSLFVSPSHFQGWKPNVNEEELPSLSASCQKTCQHRLVFNKRCCNRFQIYHVKNKKKIQICAAEWMKDWITGSQPKSRSCRLALIGVETNDLRLNEVVNDSRALRCDYSQWQTMAPLRSY